MNILCYYLLRSMSSKTAAASEKLGSKERYEAIPQVSRAGCLHDSADHCLCGRKQRLGGRSGLLRYMRQCKPPRDMQ